MRLGDRFQNKVSTTNYIVTMILDDMIELKFDKDCSTGIIISQEELARNFTQVKDVWEMNYCH